MIKKRLWIVTELFYPEDTATSYILTNIANYMAGKYEVHVICGPSRREEPNFFSIDEKVVVHRMSHFDYNKNNLVKRSLRLFLISLILSFKTLLFCKRTEKVLSVTNPAPLIVFMSIVKKFKGIDLIVLAQDIFPENAVAAGIINREKWYYRLLKSVFDKAYSRANSIITVGRDMKDIIISKISRFKNVPPVFVINDWADIDLFNDVSYPLEDNHNIIKLKFTGNIGRVQGLLPFLHSFCKANNSDVVFELWGDGAFKKKLELFAKYENCENIIFKGVFTRDQQNVIMSDCDLALVTLTDGMLGLGVPSKAYNCMAAGKPILYIGPLNSELDMLIKEYNIGWSIQPLDEDGILNFLHKLSPSMRSELKEKGKEACKLARSRYSKEKILQEFYDCL